MARRFPMRQRWGSLLVEALRQFHHDGGWNLSAAIAYYALLSLLPLLLLSLTILAHILGTSAGAYAFTVNLMKSVLPATDQMISEEIRALVLEKRVGQVSSLIFLWLATLVFTSVEHAINTVFKSAHRRPLPLVLLLSIFMVFLVGTLAVLSLAATSVTDYLQTTSVILRGESLLPTFLLEISFEFLLPLFLTFLIFTLIYAILPVAHVPWRHAVLGGFIAALLWEGARHIFAWYVTNVKILGTIYGSLTAAILLLLWIFYSAAILLYGAELAAQRARTHPQG